MDFEFRETPRGFGVHYDCYCDGYRIGCFCLNPFEDGVYFYPIFTGPLKGNRNVPEGDFIRASLDMAKKLGYHKLRNDSFNSHYLPDGWEGFRVVDSQGDCGWGPYVVILEIEL